MEALLHDTVGMIGQLGGQELNFQMFRDTSDAQDDGDDSCQDSDEDTEELTEGISVEQLGDGCAEENSNFLKLLRDAEEELFPGCKTFSKLSFIIHLYHIKCLGGWTEKSFTKVLELLGRVFGEHSSWPKSSYEAKKIIKALGLNYEKIHVCKQDCMLFWREYASAESCHICGTSRWVDSTKKRPVKVLRYFPLVPRLQRFFILEQTANDMRWHDEGRNKDGILRHPADGEAWKSFDARYPDFSSDSRNVRLALASDGFNPFRMMSSNYSVWPVVLVPYNLPPWIGMKQHSFILSMIIPGDKGPTNDIDVFLQPLIEELKKLWEGVETYDASKHQKFHMRAALMWTINDFPAYAYLSGWSTKGKFACPCCAENTSSLWLYKGKKYCYMCSRRWLPEGHRFRYQKQLFDGTEEVRLPPKRASGSDVLNQLDGLQFTFGKFMKKKGRKENRKKKRKRTKHSRISVQESNEESSSRNDKGLIDHMKWWKKRSIFFMLPYWEHNLLRHNLDLMHIEKNVCDNLIGTFLGLDKSKDNLKARLDLVDIGIRFELHPQILENGKKILPPACFTLSTEQKEILCQVVKDIKVPDGYASNISRCTSFH
ncbi:uncharacterized protein LOC120251450 [Dioscorea cayenensis subsp. rotundata]|uniref:Uncharacterized protein LOC120251450 n=1 Tax=Dioscorea cayennensis subsp. rotundata TaxID=55577 RepID=A0AB40AM25_DIOCR|nr:uncharacterized protein LOC120251450 [Dioscorea cayenensis subsp. rotundata]